MKNQKFDIGDLVGNEEGAYGIVYDIFAPNDCDNYVYVRWFSNLPTMEIPYNAAECKEDITIFAKG